MSCSTNHQGHGDHEEDEMQVADSEGVEESNENFAESSTEMTNTCEALCSLSCSPPPASSAASVDSNDDKSSRRSTKGCPKQHQLPMFLSSKYSRWPHGCLVMVDGRWQLVATSLLRGAGQQPAGRNVELPVIVVPPYTHSLTHCHSLSNEHPPRRNLSHD